MDRFGMPQMYLRTGQALITFTIEKLNSAQNSRGREVNSYKADSPAVTFEAFKAHASQKAIERYKQMEHPITHTIKAQACALAKVGDRLVDPDGAKLYIQGIENPMGLGFWTLYQCEERMTEGGVVT